MAHEAGVNSAEGTGQIAQDGVIRPRTAPGAGLSGLLYHRGPMFPSVLGGQCWRRRNPRTMDAARKGARVVRHRRGEGAKAGGPMGKSRGALRRERRCRSSAASAEADDAVERR